MVLQPMPGNPHPSASWKPGQRPEGAGRPVGSRNRRTQEVLENILALGHQDPLITLSYIQNNDGDPMMRATAANMLAPYLHSKNATKPIQPDPVFFDTDKLPRPANIAEACNNIALLSEKKATGELDVVTADSLINDQRIILNAMVDEVRLLTSKDNPNTDRRIIIEGGMPPLPGTDVIMPQFINGQHFELEANKDPINHATDYASDHSVPEVQAHPPVDGKDK